MAPIIVNKENKKQEILQAALSVFSRLGITNTKMIDVATEAGIGKGTIYEYFRSKDEIIAEAFHAFLAKMDHAEIDPADSEMDSLQLLFHVIDGWMHILVEEPVEAKLMIEMWAESTRSEDKSNMNVLREVYKEYQDYIISILDRGIKKGELQNTDSKSLATLIAASLDGLYLTWIMAGDLVNLEESVSVLKSILELSLRIE